MSNNVFKVFTSGGGITVPAGVTKLSAFLNTSQTFFGSYSQILPSGNGNINLFLKADGSAWGV